MKNKVLLLAPLEDGQSGVYIYESLENLGYNVGVIDFRLELKRHKEMFYTKLIENMISFKPDYVLVLKGAELDFITFKNIMKKFPDTVFINWIFDVTLGGTLVEESTEYIEFIKEFDYFFTISKGSVENLRKLGVNCFWLPEGCHIVAHKYIPPTYWQERMFSADIAFIGSIGSIHKNRIEILKKLINYGFNIKLYGDIYNHHTLPKEILEAHTGYAVINDYHSIVVNCSKIVLGIDGWTDIELSHSARLYRTLCAGGFYLTTHTKGLEKMFKPKVHLDVYENPDDLIQKAIFYLEHPELRAKISKQGQELVMNNYTFEHSLKYLFEMVKTNKQANIIKEKVI